MTQILNITSEDEWNSLVWEYMSDHPDDYPTPDDDFDRAETDIIYHPERTDDDDEHLRQLGII